MPNINWEPQEDHFHFWRPDWYNLGLLDSTLTRACRAGGLGNETLKKRTYQCQLYNGSQAAHGYQSAGMFFPNGMMAISDPCYGKVHDSARLRASRWIDFLEAASAAVQVTEGCIKVLDTMLLLCIHTYKQKWKKFWLLVTEASTHLCPDFVSTSKMQSEGKVSISWLLQ
jgi:hypothetical protein